MKKLRTILVAIISCSFTLTYYSQSFNKIDFTPKVERGKVVTASQAYLNNKLKSVLGQIWVPSNWVDDTKQTFEYNDAGLTSKSIHQKLENSEWKTGMEVLFEYNAEKQMVVDIMWFYEDDGAIGMGTKWEHTYSGNKIDEGIRSDWDVDNGKWETRLKWAYEYTGELVTKISEYRFILDWDLSQQYTFTYDAQEREIEELTEIWNESESTFVNSYIITTSYHQDKLISRREEKSWDVDNQQWSVSNYFLFEYEYDANGNCIEDVTTFAMEFMGTSSIIKSKTQCKYDSNNYLIEDLDFTWDDATSVWLELSKSEYTNDAEGNPLVIIIYNKLSGTWDYSEKITYTYDGAVDVESDKQNIPETFNLSQNYPNPFNPSTTIKYSIPAIDVNFTSTTNVILKIYNALGKEVATLVNEVKQPGNYEVEFNAHNLTSGIYYYTLQTGEFKQTKKCILIK